VSAAVTATPESVEAGLQDPETPSHVVLAVSRFADDRARVLKHGDTFAVFDHHGGIKPGGLGEEGLYHEGTRFLSRLSIELEGNPLFYLGNTVRGEHGQLVIALTNPDLVESLDAHAAPQGAAEIASAKSPATTPRVRLTFGTLHLSVRTFLWRAVCYRRIRIRNHGREPVSARLTLRFGSDFADIFEVRGRKRPARGVELPSQAGGGEVVLSYRGLDEVVRRSVLRFTPEPAELSDSAARFDLRLAPKEETEVVLSISCERDHPVRALVFEEARGEVRASAEQGLTLTRPLLTSSAQVNAWIERAGSDVEMMTTDLPTGPYPYAGVPWFNTPFGRDGILTALECLWLRPALARGVLKYLASTQATDLFAARDAEPGKILHETRGGEMAALNEIPYGLYYGTADATPLFVMLAGAYYDRTGDRELIASLWPQLEAALAWTERDGDLDGDGFVEYQRQTPEGLLNQGWKDSSDALFHADGTTAAGPIALCEVQAYVYAARLAGATLAAALGKAEAAAELLHKAGELRRRFEQRFWCEEIGTYAIALDGDKRPCAVRTSNAGHCLFTGIAGRERAERVAAALMGPDSFSGWGVRTVASSEARYNPMAYHNGSVWPHDNALIAQGLARYGKGEEALRILTGLFEAGTHFEGQRMPELFCGFGRERGEGPVLYPVACSPQAWAAGSVFLLFQACLGLSISALDRQVRFVRPRLPEAVQELRIFGLEVAGSSVDLLLTRHDYDVGVDVLRREGPLQVAVLK